MLTDETFYQEIQPEWREAVKRIAMGEPDRTDLMKSSRRIVNGQFTVGEIIGAVSVELRIGIEGITGPRSTAPIVQARTIAMCLAHDLRPDLTYDQIAGEFSREKSSVGLAIERAQRLLDSNTEFCHLYRRIRWRLGLLA